MADLTQKLSDLLNPILEEVLELLSGDPKTHHPYSIELPESDTVDLPIEELQSYVARTSNAYGRAARFAGLARAQAKVSKGAYERKFKQSRMGKNEAERDYNGMEACHNEHVAMINAEAVAEMADRLENGARVASESARKLLDTSKHMLTAARRETHGAVRDDEFRL